MALFSNWLQTLRYKKISPYLEGKILDVGCGNGNLLKYMPTASIYFGVDRNKKYQRQVSSLAKQLGKKAKFIKLDVDKERLPKNLPNFDTIVLCAVIEHLRNPSPIFTKFTKVSNRNTKILITTPTPLGGFVHRLGARIGLFSRKAAEEHKHFYTKKEIEQIIRPNWQIKRNQFFELFINQIFFIKKHV